MIIKLLRQIKKGYFWIEEEVLCGLFLVYCCMENVLCLPWEIILFLALIFLIWIDVNHQSLAFFSAVCIFVMSPMSVYQFYK